MFRGVHDINMDAKGRLAMPARLRERLLTQSSSGEMVITIDTQKACLAIYPLPEWERVEKMIQDLPNLNPAIKSFQRLVLGYATDVELDSNGRLLLPKSLRDHAKLDKHVVFVGQGNKMELWSEDLWIVEREKAQLVLGAEAELPAELLALKL